MLEDNVMLYFMGRVLAPSECYCPEEEKRVRSVKTASGGERVMIGM